MKKLLVVALIATSVVSLVEARHCGRRDRCERRENNCNAVCKLPASKVVSCSTETCEGKKPDFCYLAPVPGRVHKNTLVTTTYECVPCDNPCYVKPDADQLQQLIDAGAIEEHVECGL